jgi:hypothetical protein
MLRTGLTRTLLTSLACCLGLVLACGDDGTAGTAGEAETTGDGDGDGDPGDGDGDGSNCDEPIVCAWMLNEDDEVSAELTQDGGPLYVNVQSVTVDADFVTVEATGIPNYRVTITDEIMSFLTGRPNAANDFVGGAPTVAVGDVVDWGHDIGYQIPPPNEACYSTYGGGGWWPPGPSCPTDQGYSFTLPRTPAPPTKTCYAIIGQPSAVLVNGVVSYNWADGGSYLNQNVWHQLAQKFETYDLDLCLGHATMTGTYHQHLDTPCLAEQLGDDGSGHSPIYGFAADGYPVHGKWHEGGVQVQSCWMTRDYDDPNSATGCGAAGVRDCVLVDNTDPAAGTTPADSPGPNTDEIVTSFSGNDFLVESGFYYEDYYFDADCFAQGGRYLDEHNGHDHDGLGYHYHVSETFPYQPGPTFAGELQAGAPAICSDTPYGGMMPPPGP